MKQEAQRAPIQPCPFCDRFCDPNGAVFFFEGLIMITLWL